MSFPALFRCPTFHDYNACHVMSHDMVALTSKVPTNWSISPVTPPWRSHKRRESIHKNTTAKISRLLKREPQRTLIGGWHIWTVHYWHISWSFLGALIQEKDEQHYYMLPSNNLSHYLATVFHVALVTSYIWTLVYSTYVTSHKTNTWTWAEERHADLGIMHYAKSCTW